MRFRSVDQLVAQAEVGLKYRKRLGLVGPAVADHPRFEELLTRLKEMGAKISVSSLRVKPLYSIALRELAKGGTRTVALAPEAGSERLRRVIKKGITEDDILKAMHQVAEEKIKQIKLYFMIGLPTETDEDIAAITDLTLKCKAILDRRQTGTRLILSVAPFVPKAGTPFEWLPMEKPSVLKQRLAWLKKELQPKGIQIKSESPDWSEVQAVLARGDAKLAEVLANVEAVSLSGWRKAVRKYDLDTNHYAHERWNTTEELPWSILDSGTKPSCLELELQRALSQKP
ncbi:MAG: B12-binding domain-containing radical SAM protein [Dehalococcoidales bacterium]|nr:B12-binding domain-containing radical SAM protein [Dehalococcoidales bacterium]